jgi:hypothetical protein
VQAPHDPSDESACFVLLFPTPCYSLIINCKFVVLNGANRMNNLLSTGIGKQP